MSYDGKGRGKNDGKGGGKGRGQGRDQGRGKGGGQGRDRARDRARDRDRGQVALEYLGFVPILILVAMAGVQIGLIAYTAQQAGTAARAGARAASLRESAQEGCVNAISGFLADGTECSGAEGGDEVTVTATVQIPSIVPGWDFDPARKSATMPLDH